eukprot:g4271.t1
MKTDLKNCNQLLLMCCFLTIAAIFCFNINKTHFEAVSSTSSKYLPYRNNLTVGVVETTQLTNQKVDLRVPRFYVFDLFKRQNKAQSLREECEKSQSKRFCDSMFSASEREMKVSESKIFIVPIFEPSSSDRETTITAIDRLKKNRQFMKFRGSDFVFICYTMSCKEVLRELLSALGAANRSMWVSRKEASSWYCMNRMISIPERVITERKLQSDHLWETQVLQHVLREANEKIKGRNRWSCTSRVRWGIDHNASFEFRSMKGIAFKSSNDKVLYCGLPKVGSSVAVLMMRRMNKMPDWKQANTIEIRNFNTGYQWNCTNQDEVINLFDKSDWVKGVLVRDPISRLLSGYRSKIEDLKQFQRIPGGWNSTEPPSFSEFVHRLNSMKSIEILDPHFRPQSALCGIRKLPYDFIGRYEDRENEIKDLLQSLELWQSIGSTGWGTNETGAIYSQDEQIIRRKKLKPVTHADSKATLRQYYTEDLVRIVMKLYDEDFERFQFSRNVEDYL